MGHDDSPAATHAMIDKIEHELHSLEFNKPFDVVEIRKLKAKLDELKVKAQESELSFGQF